MAKASEDVSERFLLGGDSKLHIETLEEKLDRIMNTNTNVAVPARSVSPSQASSKRSLSLSEEMGKEKENDEVNSPLSPEEKLRSEEERPNKILETPKASKVPTTTTKKNAASSLLSSSVSSFQGQYTNLLADSPSSSSSSASSSSSPPSASSSSVTRRSLDTWSLSRRKSDVLGSTSSSSSSSQQQQQQQQTVVRVSVRVRPYTTLEHQQGVPRRVVYASGSTVQIVNPHVFEAELDTIVAAANAVHNKEWAQSFRFNHCLWSFDPTEGKDEADDFIDQEGVYRAVGCELVESILSGVSASFFAYGHTNSGKSYTLFGNSSGSSGGLDASDSQGLSLLLSEQSGLVPRVMTNVIKGVLSKDGSSEDTKMTLSFAEIFDEKIKDLLSEDADSGHTLRVREHPVNGPYVEGLTKMPVSSAVDFMRLLQLGLSRRLTANPSSAQHLAARPQAHVVVTLELVPVRSSKGESVFSTPSSASSSSTRQSLGHITPVTSPVEAQQSVRLQIIDLAGFDSHVSLGTSEPFGSSSSSSSTSASSTAFSSSNSVKKADVNSQKLIRRSLSTLNYIIKALGKGASVRTLPYRDSMLTWVLRDTLSGKNLISMLANISPCASSYEESLYTLKYASQLCITGPSTASSAQTLAPTPNSSQIALAVALEQQLQQQQLQEAAGSGGEVLVDGEFSKIHQNLGANRPGSQAARQLLKNQLNDPQQRIQKRLGSVPGSKEKAAYGGKFVNVNDPVSTSSLEALRDHYRDLHGQFVEMQIELQTARTDRDSMLIELQAARETVANVDLRLAKAPPKINAAETAAALNAAEREKGELRAILIRKEQAVDRLIEDLKDEKQARQIAEHAAESATLDFIDRTSAMQKRINLLESELAKALEDGSGQAAHYNEVVDKAAEMARAIDKLHGDLHKSKNAYQEITLELTASKTAQNSAEGSMREFKRQAERAKAELAVMAAERDSLKRMVETQESTLKLQYQQSEASLKMLQQRQTALERFETQNVVTVDELTRLQDGLQALLTNEGSALHSEIMDARKLTGMISSMRERMQEVASLQEELNIERSARQQLHTKLIEFQAESRNNGGGGFETELAFDRSENKRLQDQLVQQQQATEAAEARARYWQQASQVTQSSGAVIERDHKGTLEQLAKQQMFLSQQQQNVEALESKVLFWQQLAQSNQQQQQQYGNGGNDAQEENRRLREQLQAALLDAENAKEDLATSQESMQKEFASLWMAVQELNKLDATKENAIRELLMEKDRYAQQLQIVTSDYLKLQGELEAIDDDLLETAHAEGVSFSTPNIADKLRSIKVQGRETQRRISVTGSGGGGSSSSGMSSSSRRDNTANINRKQAQSAPHSASASYSQRRNAANSTPMSSVKVSSSRSSFLGVPERDIKMHDHDDEASLETQLHQINLLLHSSERLKNQPTMRSNSGLSPAKK